MRVLVDRLIQCKKMDRLSRVAMRPILLLLFITCLVSNSNCESRVKLVDNGYVDLVVAITEAVDVKESEKVIENIKKIITDASPILHHATYDRAFFKSVKILIPRSWEHIVTTGATTWERTETADVLIDTPDSVWLNRPYTVQNGECGIPGEKIHLSPEYVLKIDEGSNNKLYGKPAKVFVHEWAHLRYGVFDEYQSANEYPLFYRDQKSGKILPNVCLKDMKDFILYDVSTQKYDCEIDSKTGVYDANCRFWFPKNYKPQTSLSSLHKLDSVKLFCKDDDHNFDAPNKQNDKCKQSVWSVIEKHEDFSNNKNLPIDFKLAPSIDFQILKGGEPPRFIVVTDVSKSMSDFNRIDKLGEAFSAWIMHDVPKGSKVGIVKFSSETYIVSDLTEITDENSRKNLANKIPKDLIGATCIGCGLQLAMEVLGKESKKTDDIIILITDGKNTQGRTSIKDVLEDLKKTEINVVTVGFGKEADDDLELLADSTNGKSYYIRDEETNSQNVRDAFLGALTFQPAITNVDLEFVLVKQMMAKSDSFEFFVDSTVGRNLKLTIHGLENVNANELNINLKGPNKKVVPNPIQKENNVFSITLDIVQAGKWTAEIDFKNKPPSQPVTVFVTTQLLPGAKAAIKTTCWKDHGTLVENAQQKFIKIHAEVKNDNNIVIKANVKAFIVKPDGVVDTLDLFDDGQNADEKPNDGKYSKYFTDATQQGRYTITCQVINSGSALQTRGFVGSPNPVFSFDEPHQELVKDFPLPVEKFNRVISGGSFKVEIPVPEDDHYPPGDVRDLSVSLLKQTPTNVSVEVKWTAPGDDLDFGTVSYYEVKYSDDETVLLDPNFDEKPSGRRKRSAILSEENLIAGSLHPNEAGTQQSATFLLADVPRGKNCYVALRAVDKFHKVSHVSNIGVIYIDDSDSSDTPLFASASEGTHIITLTVAGLGAILIVSFSVILLGAFIKRVLTKANYAVVPVADTKSAV